VISEQFYNRQANLFIEENFEFENTRVSSRIVKYDSDTSQIEIYLAGKILADSKIDELKKLLPKYNLEPTKLLITQDDDLLAAFEQKLQNNLNSGFNEIFYKKNEEMIKNKDSKIEFLEKELIKYRRQEIDYNQISNEIKAIFPEIKQFSYANLKSASLDSLKTDTIPTVILKIRPDSLSNNKMFSNWLKNRLKIDTVDIVLR
jgi:hypothetical protein